MSDSLSLSAGPRAAERTEATYSVIMGPIDAKGKVHVGRLVVIF